MGGASYRPGVATNPATAGPGRPRGRDFTPKLTGDSTAPSSVPTLCALAQRDSDPGPHLHPIVACSEAIATDKPWQRAYLHAYSHGLNRPGYTTRPTMTP